MKKESIVMNGETVREIILSFDDDVPTSQVEEVVAKAALVSGILEVAGLPKVTASRGAKISAAVDFDGLRGVEFLFGRGILEQQTKRRFQKIIELMSGEEIEWSEE
jgi:hypothetical protein